MGGGHVKSCMEPQHNSLWSHQFHSISATVWSRGSITQRNQTSKFVYSSEGITMPQQSLGERFVGIRQAQSGNQHVDVSRRYEVLEETSRSRK
jgi:hypothetical protein